MTERKWTISDIDGSNPREVTMTEFMVMHRQKCDEAKAIFAASKPIQTFTARFSAPGFYETETIHADDLAAAQRRAAEIAQEPYSGWPPVGCSKIKIHGRAGECFSSQQCGGVIAMATFIMRARIDPTGDDIKADFDEDRVLLFWELAGGAIGSFSLTTAQLDELIAERDRFKRLQSEAAKLDSVGRAA